MNGLDAGMRDALKWKETKAARYVSDAFAFGVIPAASYGVSLLMASQDGRPKEFWADALVITESAALALGFTQLMKFAIGRERPFVHAKTPEDREADAHADDNLSFISGHTSVSFAFYAATATVASMRSRKLAPWIWGVGGFLAAIPAYLRMAGDRHYFTDVVLGGGIGMTFGIAVPRLFHGPAGMDRKPDGNPFQVSRIPAIAPVRGGATMVLHGTF